MTLKLNTMGVSPWMKFFWRSQTNPSAGGLEEGRRYHGRTCPSVVSASVLDKGGSPWYLHFYNLRQLNHAPPIAFL